MSPIRVLASGRDAFRACGARSTAHAPGPLALAMAAVLLWAAVPASAQEETEAEPDEPATIAEPPVPEPAPERPEPAEKRSPAPDPAASDEKAEAEADWPPFVPADAVRAAAEVAAATRCEDELRQRGVVFSVAESISEEQCGVLRPLAVERLSSGVRIAGRTQIACRTALALDDWVTDAAVPETVKRFDGDELVAIRQVSTYVCRSRSSSSKISEHARGSAIDMGAFELASGDRVAVRAHAPGSPKALFQGAIRAAACGPFKTVLGPGTDADHATHFHFDLAARSNGSTYCK